MKKLNLYYIVSIISLAFMMFILLRTLQVTGWFEEHHGMSPVERVLKIYPGEYQLKRFEGNIPPREVSLEPFQKAGGVEQLLIRLDSLPRFLVKLSDFEDEQILIEMYEFDSMGTPQRLEGCELLLMEDEAENFKGSTMGDFCGFREQSAEYLALDLLLSGPIVSLKIQTHVRGQAENPDVQKFLLERIDS